MKMEGSVVGEWGGKLPLFSPRKFCKTELFKQKESSGKGQWWKSQGTPFLRILRREPQAIFMLQPAHWMGPRPSVKYTLVHINWNICSRNRILDCEGRAWKSKYTITGQGGSKKDRFLAHQEIRVSEEEPEHTRFSKSRSFIYKERERKSVWQRKVSGRRWGAVGKQEIGAGKLTLKGLGAGTLYNSTMYLTVIL